MDIRVLRYFLAVAREESITKAAEQLHMSQPPLSRQLKDLEKELGVQLLIRGSRKVTLTEQGMILRKRAEELVDLFNKTEKEVTSPGEVISGDIYIGAGETDAIRIIASVMKTIRQTNPGIHLQLYSGNAAAVTDRLDKGLIDFGILIEPADISKYDYIRLPATDTWGLLMRKDDPLATQVGINPEDLQGIPLFCSRQMLEGNGLSGWLGYGMKALNVIGEYDLIHNAALMVDEGIGSVLALEKLRYNSAESNLHFVPLHPQLKVGLDLVWKKYQIFSPAAALFLSRMQGELQ